MEEKTENTVEPQRTVKGTETSDASETEHLGTRTRKKGLAGYRPSRKERREGTEPEPVMTLESSYGTLDAGVNHQGKLKLVVSRKRRKHNENLVGEAKELDGESAVLLPKLQGRFTANRNNRMESALGYEEEGQKPTAYLMHRIQTMYQKEEPEALNDILPFLERDEEREEMELLRQKRREGEDRTPAEKIDDERQLESLEAVVRDKEQQQLRMVKRMDQIVARGKKKKAAEPLGLWRSFLEELPETEDEENPGDGASEGASDEESTGKETGNQ